MITPLEVPVAGGHLAAFRLGPERVDSPLVLAIHGITSNSRTWLATARALGDRAGLLAVDLRGRAASRSLPAPFGISAHVRDLLAVLDHCGRDRALVVGHSLGAYVAARLGAEHEDRVSGLILVDGGLAIPGSQGVDPEKFMTGFLGPALQRLGMTFPDREAYAAWWGSHPALRGADVEPADLVAYAAHDLVGQAPRMHPSVNPDVVRDDGLELLGASDADALRVPAVLLCAPRGMVDDPHPMQPSALVRAWAAADPGSRRAVEVPDVNHYTITLGRRGAAAVAAEILRALGPAA